MRRRTPVTRRATVTRRPIRPPMATQRCCAAPSASTRAREAAPGNYTCKRWARRRRATSRASLVIGRSATVSVGRSAGRWCRSMTPRSAACPSRRPHPPNSFLMISLSSCSRGLPDSDSTRGFQGFLHSYSSIQETTIRDRRRCRARRLRRPPRRCPWSCPTRQPRQFMCLSNDR